jgi:predicted secreted acid phosphatase
MGVDALRSNGITKKILYLMKDKNLTSKQDRLNQVRQSRILLFVGIQLVGFSATFAITQTSGSLLSR